MRIGIVGCGLIGRRRAQIAHLAGDEVKIVADVDEGRGSALANEMGCVASTDWREVTEKKELDAVVVATPNKYLAPVVISAILSGKHVLCEKPFGRNVDESVLMADATQKAGKILKVGFNHRHHPAIWKAHEFCEAGEIGEPMYIRAVYGHGGRQGYDKEWRGNADLAGGGELLDQGVHIVDLCRWFLGEFQNVFAQTGTYYWNLGRFLPVDPGQFNAGQRLEDNAFAILKSAGGQVAQFHTSWTQWKNRFSFEVFGKGGFLRIEGLGGSYGPETLTVGKRCPESGPPLEQVFEFAGPDVSWEAEWRNFTDAIHTGSQPLANSEDGLKTMEVIASLYRSAGLGTSVQATEVKRVAK